jgi:uncharacterized membrane protein YdcZ (DUF606 family)
LTCAEGAGIDHFGSLGVFGRGIDPARALGIAVLIQGAYLISK